MWIHRQLPPLACRRGTEHYLILRSSIWYAVTRCCGGCMSTVFGLFPILCRVRRTDYGLRSIGEIDIKLCRCEMCFLFRKKIYSNSPMSGYSGRSAQQIRKHEGSTWMYDIVKTCCDIWICFQCTKQYMCTCCESKSTSFCTTPTFQPLRAIKILVIDEPFYIVHVILEPYQNKQLPPVSLCHP